MTNTTTRNNLNLLKDVAVTLALTNSTNTAFAGCNMLNRTDVNCTDFSSYIVNNNKTAEMVINFVRNSIYNLHVNATNTTDAATVTFFNNATFEGFVLDHVNSTESALVEKYSGETKAYCDPIKGSRTPDFVAAQDLLDTYVCSQDPYTSLCNHTVATSALLGLVEDNVVCP